MIIKKKIDSEHFEVEYKFVQFNFDPYLDLKKIEILERICQKMNKRERSKFKNSILENLSSLDKKDPLFPNKFLDKYSIYIKKLKNMNKKVHLNINMNSEYIFFNYKNKKFRLKLNNYKRIKKRYTGDEKQMNIIIFSLLNRYNFLELLNPASGSIHPKNYKQMEKKYNCKIEGFSSFYNSNLKYYCGLFPNLERYFGCLGNIFNTKFIRGNIIFNPPFLVEFMNNFFKYINNHSATLIFILPAFKISDRVMLNKICRTQYKTNYADDYNIEILRDSNVDLDYLYCKENFLYYDFLTDKNVNFSSTNIIIKNSAKDINIKEIFGNPDIIHIDY